MLASVSVCFWLGCLLVGNPAKSTENKQFPLVAAHSDILNGLVDHLGFTWRTVRNAILTTDAQGQSE